MENKEGKAKENFFLRYEIVKDCVNNKPRI